ncbi:efflux RND transporter periplasmic adaptor subunit, partial [bacterium]|nr:efflux RND transporter periplasmic adaptor subunit [bacterium]
MTFPGGRWTSRLVVLVAIVAAFAIGRAMRGGAPAPLDRAGHADHADAEAATIWTCSMHPRIQLPDPGQCPICGMDLIPLDPGSGGSDAGPRTLTLSPAAQAIAEVSTTPAERREVRTTLRMVGKLEADETRTREISAWVAGRIDRLHIDATGVAVRAGQGLFDLYSPELYSAQEELLQALQASDTLNRSALESTRDSASRTVAAARERLRLWGLTPGQIEAIEKRGAPEDHVTITAPMSGIVMHKSAAEGMYVKKGQHVYA